MVADGGYSATARLICPSCGEWAGVAIFYGLPTFEVFEQVESGQLDVVLGGCDLPDPESGDTAACRACDARWHHPEARP